MEEFEKILKDIQSKESDDKEFEIWINNGIERGWITEPSLAFAFFLEKL